MKKNIFLSFVLCVLATLSLNAQKMSLDSETFDFGNVPEGPMVTHYYVFQNTGDKDLIITSAKGSCGCTTPEYPKEPIAPGKYGSIKVQFNTAGRPGNQTKTVTINTNETLENGKNSRMINFKAHVDAAIADESYVAEVAPDLEKLNNPTPEQIKAMAKAKKIAEKEAKKAAKAKKATTSVSK